MSADSIEDDLCDIRVRAVCAGIDIDHSLIERAVRLTLSTQQKNRCKLSIAMVDDACMSELHQRYLNISTTTDVLTFDLGDEDDLVEGEIVVCVDTAIREAASRKIPPETEALLYIVHGVLHLLGHDDHDEESARRMHLIEDDVLTRLGVGPAYRVSAQ